MKQRISRSTSIKDKWTTYSGVAAAFLATASDADAQIIFTDVNPDSVLVTADFEIDFDGDGNTDITITHSITSSGIQVAGVNVPTGAAVLGALSSPYMYPNVVAGGAPITPADPDWQTQAFGSLFYAAGSTGFGQWNGQSGFLAVRFQDGGGMTHYAWVELEVATGATQATVLGYAYETTPDQGIIAGDTGGATGINGPDADPPSMDVFPNPAADHARVKLFSKAPGTVQVRILNGTGQVLFAQQERIGPGTRDISLDLHTFPAGTYFVEARTDGQVMHRKLVKE